MAIVRDMFYEPACERGEEKDPQPPPLRSPFDSSGPLTIGAREERRGPRSRRFLIAIDRGEEKRAFTVVARLRCRGSSCSFAGLVLNNSSGCRCFWNRDCGVGLVCCSFKRCVHRVDGSNRVSGILPPAVR